MKERFKTLLMILIVFFIGCHNPKNKTIQVKINKNIETLFILYPLVDIGAPPPTNKSLCSKAYIEFGAYKKHDAVKLLDTIISRTDISEPVNLVLHFSELPDIKQIYSIDTSILKIISGQNDMNIGQNLIDDFIIKFFDFYKEANVESFFTDHNKYYKKAIKNVTKNLPPKDFVKTMEQYYGQVNQKYILNPSPVLYPGFGFGARIRTEDGLLVFNTFSPLNKLDDDSEILFDFNNYKEIRDLAVHEFGHSFVNPITELPENIKKINQYSYLFSPIERDMLPTYGTWCICVTEHLVRLGEIRIALVMNDSSTANKIRRENIEIEKFIYLPYLEEKIIEYEKNREIYKTFSDFFPELIRVFSKIDTTKINI